MNKKTLSHTADWDFQLLESYEKEIAEIASSYKLDTYPNQIEIITAEQMIDAYSRIGMPLGYSHWSFGKEFLNTEKKYRKGQIELAYELVINANPCITYLMEENSMVMQALVIAHACYGHNSFFKNNYLFKMGGHADSIIDYLVFAREYITCCEEKHGINEVEEILDACHALMNYGVDRYAPSSTHEENILKFIEENSPSLEPWQRKIIKIVRTIAQYFYPQRQTKVMNEGWACFWHYTIINALYDKGLVNDEFMLEFLQLHTNALTQPAAHNAGYFGINPYALGFELFSDIRRICEHPTEEDTHWFPNLANTPWLNSLDFAMRNFKDESFIAQYLSPKLIRHFKLFSILDDEEESDFIVTDIHDEAGYHPIRLALSAQYNLSLLEPNIQVHAVDLQSDHSLILRHIQYNQKQLNQDVDEVLRHLHRLWGFPVHLESIDAHGEVQISYSCPPLEKG